MESLYNDVEFHGMNIANLGGYHEIHCLGYPLQIYTE